MTSGLIIPYAPSEDINFEINLLYKTLLYLVCCDTLYWIQRWIALAQSQLMHIVPVESMIEDNFLYLQYQELAMTLCDL